MCTNQFTVRTFDQLNERWYYDITRVCFLYFKHELHINFETNHLSSYSSIRARTVHFSNIQFTTPLSCKCVNCVNCVKCQLCKLMWFEQLIRNEFKQASVKINYPIYENWQTIILLCNDIMYILYKNKLQ